MESEQNQEFAMKEPCNDKHSVPCAALEELQENEGHERGRVCDDDECWICPAKVPEFAWNIEPADEQLSAEILWEGLHIDKDYGRYKMEELCIEKECEGVCNDEQCRTCTASRPG